MRTLDTVEMNDVSGGTFGLLAGVLSLLKPISCHPVSCQPVKSSCTPTPAPCKPALAPVSCQPVKCGY